MSDPDITEQPTSPARGSLDGVVMPKSVELALQKFNKNRLPHERKTLEVACIIHATNVENAIWCLEELAQRLREGSVDYMGHGCGHDMSMAWASVDKGHNAPS